MFVVDAPQLKAADARQRESEAKLSFDVRRQELLAKQMKEKLDREVGWCSMDEMQQVCDTHAPCMYCTLSLSLSWGAFNGN